MDVSGQGKIYTKVLPLSPFLILNKCYLNTCNGYRVYQQYNVCLLYCSAMIIAWSVCLQAPSDHGKAAALCCRLYNVSSLLMLLLGIAYSYSNNKHEKSPALYLFKTAI